MNEWGTEGGDGEGGVTCHEEWTFNFRVRDLSLRTQIIDTTSDVNTVTCVTNKT